MSHNYKNDIKITYDSSTKSVKATWTDWEMAERGKKGNSRRRTRKIKIDEFTTRKEAEERLRIIAEREQKESIERADALRNKIDAGDIAPDSIKVPFATRFLRKLENHQITSSLKEKTIRDARKAVDDFCDWLDKNYPNILLNKITKIIAESYFKSLEKKFAFSSIKTYRAYLVYTFNSIIDYFEEATFKILNPFSRVTLKKVLNNTVENRKAIFSQDELIHMLKRAGESDRLREPLRIQRFTIFYLLMVTGWRVGDIADMTWDGVNFHKRYIANLHAKTEKTTGVHTKVYMTDLMERLLKLMQSYPRPDEFKKYIFSVGRYGVQDLHQRIVTNTQTHMDNMREELHLHEASKRGKHKMHSHTIHSIRGSFITHMVGEGHQETLVDYIVGHNLSSINAKHYSRYDSDPEKFTRSIVEDMEKFIDARASFVIITKGKKVYIPSEAAGLDNEGFFESLIDDGWTNEAIEILKKVSNEHPLEMRERARDIAEYKRQKRAKIVDENFIIKFIDVVMRAGKRR